MSINKISIITPSYNQGQFIEDTIQSILSQGYDNFEHIIIDACSTDNTLEVIKKYTHLIWLSEADNGQTDAINKGLLKATGNILCWINSDDVLLPGALIKVNDFFNKNPNVEFLNGLSLEINKNGIIQKQTHVVINKWFAEHGCFNVCQQGMFWRKGVFNKVELLNPTFHACMDWEFIVRLYENKITMKQINLPLGAIRVYDGTKTALGDVIWENDWNKLAKRYNGKYIPNRKSIYFVIYVLIKFIRGYYISDKIFKMKHKNKRFNEIKIK